MGNAMTYPSFYANINELRAVSLKSCFKKGKRKVHGFLSILGNLQDRNKSERRN